MSFTQLIDTALSCEWLASSECAGLKCSSQRQRELTSQLVALNSEGVGDLDTSIGPTLELALPQHAIDAATQPPSEQPRSSPQRLCQPLDPAPGPSSDLQHLQLAQHLEHERRAANLETEALEALDSVLSRYLKWEARVTCIDGEGEKVYQAQVHVGKARHWSLFQLESENPRFQLGLTFPEPIAATPGTSSLPRVCQVQVTVRTPGVEDTFTLLNHVVSLDLPCLTQHKTEEYAETEETQVRKIFIGSRKQCTMTLSQPRAPALRPHARSPGLTIQLPDGSTPLVEHFDQASFHTPLSAEAEMHQSTQDDITVGLHSSNPVPVIDQASAVVVSDSAESSPAWRLRDMMYHLSVAELGRCLGVR